MVDIRLMMRMDPMERVLVTVEPVRNMMGVMGTIPTVEGGSVCVSEPKIQNKQTFLVPIGLLTAFCALTVRFVGDTWVSQVAS